jgi:hypothetical protein
MAFCGRGWSERALDPDPHDLLIRGWAALVRPIATTTRQDALRIFAFAARFQDTELQPRRARCFPDSFDVALSIDARKADQRRPGSDRRHRRAITGIIEPCRPWLSWVGLHRLQGVVFQLLEAPALVALSVTGEPGRDAKCAPEANCLGATGARTCRGRRGSKYLSSASPE